ncbi:16S rRNA (cytidine1402-2'-O)-methyltransferase [Catalinimonas alkaloidigena]|uniref:16S rRNA (Cytidine1402-2'-O)-methyltransferase n=1 Tax=Catalinimonas alkaloidigena TaxID=1075417 RepID=A0A1G9MLP2_9BACT|nr:SAM-dependent methyltransferase [Catalinimonas alkaloidigena]SDL75129.1 16S rRNA (cytidine1402-2'-O)-methyltransferase [Catalinimonas alkaloidigena]
MKATSKGRLFLIPTVLSPDTEAQVLPPQVPETIRSLQHFLVENVRTARRFISGLRLGISIESLQFYELSKHTEVRQIEQYLDLAEQGHDLGILSEAGCPGVADPGARAVAGAHRRGIPVVPLVGPSSILLALMASGFSGQSFAFHGYLPIASEARIKALQGLEKEAQKHHQTQIFMETPYRNNPLLDDILKACRPQTLLCVAANLTSPHQLIQTQTVEAWRRTSADFHKIPAIFLLSAS